MAQENSVEKAKIYIQEGKYREAQALLDAFLAVSPSDTYALFERAKIALLKGSDAEAEEEFRKVIALDPAFHQVRMELARIYYRQRRMELALEQYNRVVAGAPDTLAAYKELGALCGDMGAPEKAMESLKSAARLCPDNADVLFELACAMREAGDEKEAAVSFRKLLSLPTIKDDRFLHNKVLNELEITERREVLESKLRAMIAMVIDRCNIRCRICHIWEGKWQARDSIMREIVELFPYMEDICWEGGEIFMMKGFDDILAEGTRHPHLKQVIFTNGLLINENILNKLNNGRADIVFSIDAVEKESYEHIRFGGKFERLLKVLELVKEFRKSSGANINTYFNPVIMKTNHRQLEDFIEFGRRYGFNAITFTPIRGEFGEENIFERKDEEALAHIARSLPRAIAKAREYGIRLNNWLPVSCEAEEKHPQEEPASGEPCGCPAPQPEAVEKKTAAAKRMICYSPWQRLTIDSGGPARPFAFCLNKFVGNTNDLSLAEIWNGDGMRWYRRKIANDDFADLCQPECISGQVRDKICKIS
ncbi:MAG: tetratricopeptide repeat protein [Endomicrobiales bacterium]